MKLLILGGTGFLGPHIVQAALDAGHTPTLFNRGKSNAALFPDVETLHGDRDPDKGNGLSALRGRYWDAVIDICGYVPRIVAASAQMLAPAAKYYLFISTISVYSDLSAEKIDERSPVGYLADPTVEKVTGETYGPLKVLCEQAVEAAMPGRSLSIRPGLIVGPGDPTDRFTCWPVRIDRGGEALAPGDPAAPVQIIDARDLARFVVRSIEHQAIGIMNATGPRDRFEMGQMLAGCKAVTNSPAKLTWVSAEFLLQQGVKPWTTIPLWIPDTPDMRGFARIQSHKAIEAGLTFRAFEETARDTLQWFKSRPDQTLRAGLTPQRESELLRAHAKKVNEPGLP
jgi:2'-hydroxyisoflavone reductase